MAVDQVWSEITDYHEITGRRVKILEIRYGLAGYPDEGKPVGVRARVLTSIAHNREVFMSLRDLTDNYEPEEGRASTQVPSPAAASADVEEASGSASGTSPDRST